MERVIGIGGVFQRAGGDGAALRAWYAEHLGIELTPWGGTSFTAAGGESTAWALFDTDADHLGRPEQTFMINFRVRDLDAMLRQLRASGAQVSDTIDESEHGRFGWALDPEGTKFELWEPPAGG